MINKFTFKCHKPTGRFRSFSNPYWDIQLKRKRCGTILKNGFDDFSISFSIKKEKTTEDPAPFKNITLKARFKTIEETKAYLVEHTDAIIEKFDLFIREDYA